jgi:hypothetical protein
MVPTGLSHLDTGLPRLPGSRQSKATTAYFRAMPVPTGYGRGLSEALYVLEP